MATIGQRPIKRTVVTDIEYTGTKITLPDDPRKMALEDAKAAIEARIAQEEQITMVVEAVNATQWDFARAVWVAMGNVYGWAQGVPTPGWFGSDPPVMIDVEIGYRLHIQVPWGRIVVPGFEDNEYFETSLTKNRDGMNVGQLIARVRYKHLDEVNRLVAEVRRVVEEDSIYKGKAFKLRLSDEDGDPLDTIYPEFLDVSNMTEDRLVFNHDLEEAIRTNLFGPIENYEEFEKFNEPFRVGVALVGKYGTGKTELALTAANKAVANNITFIYLEDVRDLPQGILWARLHEPAVVFAEDLETITKGGRSVELNEVFNTVDGLDAKKSKVMLVTTTNNPELIHQGMMRPGRIDVALHITPPDAEASERLIRLYAGELLDEDEDISEPARIQAGKIPAITREVVRRAKRAQIRRSGTVKLTCASLYEAARTMEMQEELLNAPERVHRSDLENAALLLGNFLGEAINRSTQDSLTLATSRYGDFLNVIQRNWPNALSKNDGLTVPSAELEHAAGYDADAEGQ